MDERRWYEAEVLMADSTYRRHAMLGVSEEEIEHWIRSHYPNAVVLLVRERTRQKARFGSYMRRAQGGQDMKD
ncbi:MAG: hypothetical protein ACRDTR_22810 [Rubrobacter sp.]